MTSNGIINILSNMYEKLLQLLSLVLEFIGLGLAFIDLRNRDLANKINYWIIHQIKVSKCFLCLEPKINWILYPIIMWGGLVTVLFFIEVNNLDYSKVYGLFIFALLLVLGSLICLFTLIFTVTNYISKRKRLGSFGLSLASVGFLLSVLLFRFGS